MLSISVLADQLMYFVVFSAVVTGLDTKADDLFASVVRRYNATCAVSKDGIFYVEAGTGNNNPSSECCGFCETSADCVDYGSCCLKQYGSFETGRSAILNTRFKCVGTTIFVADIEKSRTFTPFSKNVWMITDCSDEANTYEPYYKRCATVDTNDYFNSVVPVTVQNITFKNKFCAYCNGVSESQQMTYWDIEIGCDSSISPTDDDIYDQLKKRNCTLKFNTPVEVDARPCREQTYSISVCNTTGLWPMYNRAMELACHSFVAPFNRTYQNYFCYLCNSDQAQAPENWHCPALRGDDNKFLPPFIALINIDAVQQWRKDNQLECNIVNQFLDKKKMICRDIECEEELQLIGQKCQRIFDYEADLDPCYLVKIAIKLTPKGNVFISDADLEDDYLPWDILIAFLPVTSSFVFLNNCVIYEKSFLLKERRVVEYFVVHVTFEFGNYWYESLSSLVVNFHNVTIDVHVYKTNDTISFESEIVSLNTTGADVNTLYFSGSHNATADRLTRYFRLSDVVLNSSCYSIDFHKLHFCPFIQIAVSEMSVKIENDFLIVEDPFLNIIFSRWEYAVRNDKILYCVDDFWSVYDVVAWPEGNSSTNDNRVISTSRIVSFICVCISIICLFITICTYVATPKLRTQPGISNVILCVSLLLAQTFYQFGAGQTSLSYIACSVIGALCHFFWLCVMFSMNACSLQMFNIFRKRVRLSPIFNWKTAIKTVLYVICSSVSFVIINLVLSLLTSGGTRSGYVGGICYLSDFLMHLITFIIPTAVTICINMFLFSYVVFVIRKSSYTASTLNQDRNYFGIYARLSTLTGITWIFGYLHLFVESKIIEYLFIAFNGCQGVFLMIAFVLKRKRCSIFCRRSAIDKTDSISTKVSKLSRSA